MVARDGTSAATARGRRKGELAARNTRVISHLIQIRNVDEQGHVLKAHECRCKGGGGAVRGGGSMCRR